MPRFNTPLLRTLGLIGLFFASASGVHANQGLTDFNNVPQQIENVAGKGQWLVVMLWASDCHVCNQEAHQYIEFHNKHNKGQAHVLGISLDGQAKKQEAKEFISKHHVSFPNWIGEPVTVAELYQSLTGNDWVGTPSFMVYNPKGELVGAQAGAIPPALIESFIKQESTAN